MVIKKFIIEFLINDTSMKLKVRNFLVCLFSFCSLYFGISFMFLGKKFILKYCVLNMSTLKSNISIKHPVNASLGKRDVEFYKILNNNFKIYEKINTKKDNLKNELNFLNTNMPKTCLPQHKVAIIIPYRKRLDSLRIILRNIHPFLSKQLLDYRIFLIEPIENITFNRGLLMNIGFVEASKQNSKWNCFVFHDVDLIPQNEQNLYSCSNTPKHMSSAVDYFKYK